MALQDDAMSKFFGWLSSGEGSPISSGAAYRDAGQDIIEATFDPEGAAHTKYAADKAAEEAAKVKYAADQAKYQQDLQTYNQESARISAENAKKLSDQQAADQAAAQAAAQQQQAAAAPAANPYASFYGLTARQQRRAAANPRGAQRKWGIDVPPAGYTTPVGTAAPPATGSAPYQRPTAPTEPTESPTAPTKPGEPIDPQSLWKSYNQYYAGNSAATTDYNKGTQQQRTAWGDEYNKYKGGLPLIYQDLINYGISPEQVANREAITLARQFGQEVIPTDYNEAMRIYGTKRGGPSDQGVGLNIWTPTAQYPTPASQYSKLSKV